MELISIESAKEEMARIEADKFVPVPKHQPEEGANANTTADDKQSGDKKAKEKPSPLKGADKRTIGAVKGK